MSTSKAPPCVKCGVELTATTRPIGDLCFNCGMLSRPHNVQVCPRCKRGPRVVRLYLQGVACDECAPALPSARWYDDENRCRNPECRQAIFRACDYARCPACGLGR